MTTRKPAKRKTEREKMADKIEREIKKVCMFKDSFNHKNKGYYCNCKAAAHAARWVILGARR